MKGVIHVMKLYEVDSKYIDYLGTYAPHLFHNKQKGQQNERKYIGVVLEIHGVKYFAPLSSFKDKHKKMHEGLDFIKISTYAVININNMFPVPEGLYTYVDYSKEKNLQYKKLLMTEYRIIRKMQDKIRKNARELYRMKVEKQEKNALTKRCNDFRELEKRCKEYSI